MKCFDINVDPAVGAIASLLILYVVIVLICLWFDYRRCSDIDDVFDSDSDIDNRE